MSIVGRVAPALGAAVKHLALSALVAALAAGLVFGLWYPAPYGALAGGFALFGLVVVVDVVCGPLLTLVVYDRRKPRAELLRDIVFIVLLQLAALAYGLYSVASARPIYLAYEGNRFRVVSMADIDAEKLSEAPPEFRSPGFGGPRLIGARLADPSDADYRDSVMRTLAGDPPSFRPGRWVSYQSQRALLDSELKSIGALKTKHPAAIASIEQTLVSHSLTEDAAGYLPVDAQKADPADWVVIVDRASGLPRAFLPLDGW